MKLVLLSCVMVLQLLVAKTAEACSAFCFCSNKEKIVVGKSYDWYLGHDHGAVFTNARGCQRSALILDNSPNPAKWTAKYGSVTFTQFGRGFPLGGMNEKGLVIEILQLDETEYNSDQTELPFVNEAQWVQYQLDNYASVEEVVANLNKIRVVEAYTGVHYFLADAHGQAATVEYLEGKAVVHAGQNLLWAGITNDTYENSMKYVKENAKNKTPSPFYDRESEQRFQNVTILLEQAEKTPVDQLLSFAWEALEKVHSWITLKPSQWNATYDLSSGEISFRMTGDNQIKTFNIKNFDFSDKRGKMLDMNIDAEGNVENKFSTYTDDFNKEIVNANRFLIGPTKRNAGIAHGQQECR